jgi:hypothetical protein
MHSDALFRVRVIGTSYVPQCKNKKRGIAAMLRSRGIAATLRSRGIAATLRSRGVAASVYSRSIVGTIRLHSTISQPRSADRIVFGG